MELDAISINDSKRDSEEVGDGVPSLLRQKGTTDECRLCRWEVKAITAEKGVGVQHRLLCLLANR
jgi:hypothetical protein